MNLGKGDFRTGRQLKSKYVKNYVRLDDDSNPLEKSETMTSQKDATNRELETSNFKEDSIVQTAPAHKAIRKRKQKVNKSFNKYNY